MKPNKLKYLYMDNSGNLDLKGKIGKCRIYITNDAFEPIHRYNPYFTVESLDYKYRFTITLLWITYAGEILFDNGNYTLTNLKKIYDYINKTKDCNGNTIWYNMILSVKPRKLQSLYLEDNIFGYNDSDFNKFDIDNRQVIFETHIKISDQDTTLFIGNDFVSCPVLHILFNNDYSKESLIRLDTIQYFGRYKPNTKEWTQLVDYLMSDTLSDGKRNNSEYILEFWNFHYVHTFKNLYIK